MITSFNLCPNNKFSQLFLGAALCSLMFLGLPNSNYPRWQFPLQVFWRFPKVGTNYLAIDKTLLNHRKYLKTCLSVRRIGI